MNNKEFIAELAQRCGYTQEKTQNLVNILVEAMASNFDEGEAVSIPSFGTFEIKKRLERILVNPSTGKRMMVPPKLVLNFRPTPLVKEQLKRGGNS